MRRGRVARQAVALGDGDRSRLILRSSTRSSPRASCALYHDGTLLAATSPSSARRPTRALTQHASLLASPLGIACSSVPAPRRRATSRTATSPTRATRRATGTAAAPRRAGTSARSPKQQTVNGKAVAGGFRGEECYCSGDKADGGPTTDWTETNIFPTFVDGLNRQQYGETKYRHRHCAPILTGPGTIQPDDASGLDARPYSGGASQTFTCGCASSAVRTYQSTQARMDLAKQLSPDDPRYVKKTEALATG